MKGQLTESKKLELSVISEKDDMEESLNTPKEAKDPEIKKIMLGIGQSTQIVKQAEMS